MVKAEPKIMVEQSRVTARSEAEQDRADNRSDPVTKPGEGVSDLEAGGMNRASDSQRGSAVAKIASPTG